MWKFACWCLSLAASSVLLSPLLSALQPQPEKTVFVTKTGGSFIGVGVSEIDADRAKVLKLREEYGVEVTRVEEDGPAAKGGVKVGDVILEYNGQRLEGAEQLLRLVRETPPGREVKLSISRAGSVQTIALRTAARKVWAAKVPELNAIDLSELRLPDVPKAFMTWRSASLGIEAESLENQLAEYFGVKQGVLIRSVAKGSAADRAGLKAGDVITRADTTDVASPREVTNVLRASKGRREIPLRVMRERREITINIPLDEDRAGVP